MNSLSINLLPWRQQRLARRARRWWILLLFQLGCLVLLVVAGKMMAVKQRQRHEAALSQAQQLQQQYSARLQKIQQVMAQLQQHQRQRQADQDARQQNRRYLDLLALMASVIPDELWLTALVDKGKLISMTGVSHRYGDIVHFSRQLAKHGLLTEVQVIWATKQTPIAALEEGVTASSDKYRALEPIAFELQARWRDERHSFVTPQSGE